MKKLVYILLFVPLAMFGQEIGEIYEDGYLIHVDSINRTLLIAAFEDSPLMNWNNAVEYCSQLEDGSWYMPNWEELETMFYAIGLTNLVSNDRWSSSLIADAISNSHFYNEYYIDNTGFFSEPLQHVYMYNTPSNEIRFYGNDPDYISSNVVRPVKALEFDIFGCTDSLAQNYYPNANIDNGSCDYSGCMNPNAINFDETANVDDEESCIYSQNFVNEFQNEASTSLSSLQQALDTWNTTIDLSSGWNMFGYGCPISINVADGLSNHTESIIITKDNSGNVYMPEFGFNGIGDFTPGFGYQIKLTEAIEGFSLCDWYVNDIPEDNIVSLQDSIDILNSEILDLECVNLSACYYSYQIGECVYPEQGMNYDCNGNQIFFDVGDFAQGGIVFYVDETGQHGLVAVTQDLQGDYGVGGYEWGCYGENLVGADGTSIGTGYQNTIDIVSQGCTTLYGGITAAHAASDAQINGYSELYLPSKEELKEMFNTIGNGGLEGNLGGFENACYWSSSDSELFSNRAWTVNFTDGIEGSTFRNVACKVRPIRSF